MAQPRGVEPRAVGSDRLPDLTIPAGPWMYDALCAQTDPESFFPEKGGSTREAKSTCARCSVAAECLDFALEHQERFGVWGGMSEHERRKIQGFPEPDPTQQESA